MKASPSASGEQGSATSIYLNGSPTDNNATLFSQGAHERARQDHDVQERCRAGRSGLGQREGRHDLRAALHKVDGKVDGVYAANDGLAGGVISILKKNGQNGKVPVTGQDATVEGLQNILTGDQCMTI